MRLVGGWRWYFAAPLEAKYASALEPGGSVTLELPGLEVSARVESVIRYAMQQELWELPAGKLEAGEDPFVAAQRELTEECGVTADEYISLGEVYPTVGYDTEIIYIWAARGLHPAHMHLDDDEFLTPERVPLKKAYEMVLSGEIKDAKTVAGILKFKALLDEGRL